MSNTAIAFVITDKRNNIAILSGINDNEDAWKEVYYTETNNVFEHKEIPLIHLDIDNETRDTNYVYNISCKEDMFIQLWTVNLEEELSEKCRLSEFMSKIIAEDCCDIIENTDSYKSIVLKIFNTSIYISETTTRLMRGMLKKIDIKF